MQLKLSKATATKIFLHRERRGLINDLMDILIVTELSVKKAEQLCHRLLKSQKLTDALEEQETSKLRNVSQNVKFMKPTLPISHIQVRFILKKCVNFILFKFSSIISYFLVLIR